MTEGVAETNAGLLDGLPGVSLEELDERAALLRRTDTKYVIDQETFSDLLRSLADEHQILEIDGRRLFGYQSIYFDTPDLRCFRDHVAGRTPRFKVRTRLYRDTAHCTFEVKLKLADGETDKRQVAHPSGDPGRIEGESARCLEEALGEFDVEPPARSLTPSLRTTFTRVTLSPQEGAERVTCDLAVRMDRDEQRTAQIREGLVIVETKSEGGDSPADDALERMGIEPVSLSKYRSGIALLVDEAEDADADAATRARRFFEVLGVES